MSRVADNVLSRHRLTIEDFHRMGEAGIFHQADRVELIEGEIIDRAPIGSQHSGIVMRLNGALGRAIEDRAIMLVQAPVVLPEHSESQPDLAVLQPREDFYTAGHPRREDVLLIIEVVDTTLAYDHDVKVPLYARYGIPEVWLVDLENKRLHLFTSPSQEGYRECRVLAKPGVIVSSLLPGCPVDLAGVV